MDLTFNTKEEQLAAAAAINSTGKVATLFDVGSKYGVRASAENLVKPKVDKEAIAIEVKVDKVLASKFENADKKAQTARADVKAMGERLDSFVAILSTGLYDLKESFKFDRGNPQIVRDIESLMDKLK